MHNCQPPFCRLFYARSTANKLCELYQVLHYENYYILFVTETWLHSGISFWSLDPRQQYHVIRKDRPDSEHDGDVAVFVNVISV